MEGLLRSTFTSKTGIFGILAIVAGLVGLIPAVGLGINIELVTLGIAMVTIRHAIYKQDIYKLDPVLDRLLGDKLSGTAQELLISLLEAQDEETVAEVRARAKAKLEGEGGA